MIKTLMLTGLMLLIGQQFQVPMGTGATASSSSCPFTDNFSGSGALSASWTNVPALSSGAGTVVQNSGVAQASGGFKQGASIVTGGSCTFSASQTVQMTIVANAQANNTIEPLSRMDSSGNGYSFRIQGSTGIAQFRKYTAGSSSLITATGSCTGATTGTVVKFVVTGSSLTGYYNGTSCMTAADTTYTTGLPGLLINNGNNSSAAATQATAFSAN